MYKAGFSEIIITPAMDVWLWGYAARNKLSSGIHDDLYVKAFYLSDEKGCEMISITYDTVGIDEQTVLDIGWNINERSGVCNVTVNATHTHSAPAISRKIVSEDGQFNEKWADAAIKAACAAAFEAMKKAEPVRIYVNRGSAPLMTKNRRADETVADSDLVVLKAAGLDGNIKGMIISYACHCTVLDANNYLVSADYPGYLYKIYKERYPDCVTIFYNGAAGNLNIGYSSDASALGIDMGDIRTYENAAQKAAYLSGCIDKLLESACELAVKASFKRIELRIPIKDDLPAAEELERVITEYEIKLKKSKSPEEKRYYELKHIYNTCLYRRVRDFIIADRKYIRAESIIYSIGGVMFITIPGELFCQIGMMIKDLYRDCFIPVIVGYANGYYGYLPTKAALEAGGYESETSIISKAAEKYLVDEMRLAKVSILESLNFTE